MNKCLLLAEKSAYSWVKIIVLRNWLTPTLLQMQPPSGLKIFCKIHSKTSTPELVFNKVSRHGPTILLKRDPGKDAFLWILEYFWDTSFIEHLRTSDSQSLKLF